MRIASGDTSREVAFVAVDATDFAARETGLSSFTVYRMRDGGTPAAMTTPTVTEAATLPTCQGSTPYWWTKIRPLVRGMMRRSWFSTSPTLVWPLSRLTVELFRPKYTEGSTLTAAAINAECDTAISDASLATATALATVDSNVDAILVDTNELQTNQGNWVTATGFATSAAPRYCGCQRGRHSGRHWNDLPATLTTIEGKVDTVDTVVDGIQTDLSNGTDGLGAIKTAVDAVSAPSAASIADAVWDEAIAGHLTAGSTGASLNAAGSAGDPWATTLPGSYTGSQAGKILDDILTDTGTTLPSSISGLNDISAADVNAQVDIALSDYDGPTKAEMDAGFAGLNDLSSAEVNAACDTALSDYDAPTKAELDAGLAGLNDLDAAGIRTAVGLASADLDTQLGALPTATENADALLNRDMSAVSDSNARTPLNALRFLRNKWSVSGVTLTVTKEDDTTSAWEATLSADASANPVVGSDPA
jgi:hypothetical protein